MKSIDIETLKDVKQRLERKAKSFRRKYAHSGGKRPSLWPKSSSCYKAQGIEEAVKNIIDPMIKRAIKNRRLPDPEA